MPFLGYLVAVLFIFISVFLLSTNLNLQNKLESAQLDYENLLSEKLQLERSYYRVKEELQAERKVLNPVTSSSLVSVIDSLRQVVWSREQELTRLSKKISDLQKQLSNK